MRINARLDDEHTRKVEYLRAATGRTLTEVVKDAINHYHAEVAAGSGRASAVLARTGFIGCGEADADLSADYKRRLSDSLDAKHDHR